MNASALKKSIAISRDVLKFCLARIKRCRKQARSASLGNFAVNASRIVSVIKGMHDISADDADALVDALANAFMPLRPGLSFEDFFYAALEQWQKGLIYAKLLKTKLKKKSLIHMGEES